MSSTNYSSPDTTRSMCGQGGMGLCGSGHWSGANIAAMVLGFIIFPPLGIIALIWALMGRPIQELPGWVRDKWNHFFRGGSAGSSGRFGDTDNVVFNEYQQTQFDRIREMKEEISRRAEAFRDFRFDAKRRRDRKEFEEFMATNPEKDNNAV